MNNIENVVTEDLKKHEGFVAHEYKDHLGYSTIGFGRMIDERRGGGITQDEAAYLLNNDIHKLIDDLSNKIQGFDELPFLIKRALLNMAFQMGVDGIMSFKNMLSYISVGNYVEAANEALRSKWASQTHDRAIEVTNWIRSA